MIIREAIAADLEALSRLAGTTFSQNFGHLYHPDALAAHLIKTCSQAFFAQCLAEGEVMLLAWEGKDLIGYCKIGALSLPVEAPMAKSCELGRLYVVGHHQANGVGKNLVQAALELPMVLACDAIYLGVWEHNFRAQQFYQSFGFTAVGEYFYHVGEHKDRELIMLKKLA